MLKLFLYSGKNRLSFAKKMNRPNREIRLYKISSIGLPFIQISRLYSSLRGGGVHEAFQFRKRYFDLWVWVMAWTVDMYQQHEGGFGSMSTILPM